MTWTKQLSMTVFPIGQGLFTQTDLRVGDKLFRIVYDCGTFYKKINQAVPYLKILGGKHLDLLVISHFDWDHISYIPELLDITEGASRVWIPYVAPKMRLLYAIFAAIQSGIGGGDPPDYRQAVELTLNPRKWLEGRGVHMVEEIGPELEGDDGPPTPMIPEIPPEEDEGEFQGPKEITLALLRMWRGAFGNSSDIMTAWSPIEALTNTRAGIEPLLTLITWVKPLQEDKINKVCQRVAELLSETISKGAGGELARYCELRESEEIPESNVMNLIWLICHKKEKDKLMNLYREFCNDLNSSSLFLMAQVTQIRDLPFFSDISLNQFSIFRSGSSSPISSSYWHRLPSSTRRNVFQNVSSDADELTEMLPAFLWCGDAPTSVLNEVLSDASDRFSKRLNATRIWQIPHHGSLYSFNQQFYDKMGLAKGYVSYGYTNDFGHPNPSVIRHTEPQAVTELTEPLNFSITWE